MPTNKKDIKHASAVALAISLTDMPTTIKRIMPLPIYQYVKDYFVFYFPDGPPFYVAEQTEKLYYLIKNKEDNPLYLKWLEYLKKMKREHPEYIINNVITKRPSHTASISINTQDENIASLTIYISISLIAPFYVIVMEKILKDETKYIYISPYDENKHVFEYHESLFEATFPDYTFLCSSLYFGTFFNLLVPGLNASKPDQMLPSPLLTTFQGLFFDYDFDIKGFGAVLGDRDYKGDPYFSIEYNTAEILERRQFLTDTTVTYQAIE